jgi:hypothetical protein
MSDAPACGLRIAHCCYCLTFTCCFAYCACVDKAKLISAKMHFNHDHLTINNPSHLQFSLRYIIDVGTHGTKKRTRRLSLQFPHLKGFSGKKSLILTIPETFQRDRLKSMRRVHGPCADRLKFQPNPAFILSAYDVQFEQIYSRSFRLFIVVIAY